MVLSKNRAYKKWSVLVTVGEATDVVVGRRSRKKKMGSAGVMIRGMGWVQRGKREKEGGVRQGNTGHTSTRPSQGLLAHSSSSSSSSRQSNNSTLHATQRYEC